MRRIASVARVLHTVFATVPDEVNQEVQVVQRKRRFAPLTLAASFILAFLKDPVAKDHCMSVGLIQDLVLPYFFIG